MDPPLSRYGESHDHSIPQRLRISIAWRRRRRSMTKDLVVAIAEGMPVVLDKRRWDGRITEARVAVYVRWRTTSDVTLGGIYAIVITLLRNLCACRRWRWRRIIRRRLGMGASSKRNREQKGCHSQQLLHRGSSHASEK
jgi:hypothetical protein